MAFEIVIFGHRLPGVSMADFKTYYDTKHMPMIQKMTGKDFPVKHTRRYIERPDGENAAVLFGSPADIDFDVIANMVFEDEEAANRFTGILATKENAQFIEEDEKNFFDRNRCKVVKLWGTDILARTE
ncbi:hypothetical protein C8035_v003261 [Colletotrichum spinosum]|uniref:EthD domain-containing protein n=1 Tax=Colletotrichum spinosum TaxID=1347390 RepID=A0A4R8PWD4_9PEZI|nr:hypothetical protein C8035_v003261 [Colletotrichum spinosum]